MRLCTVIGAVALLMVGGLSASAKVKDLSPSKDNSIFESTNANAQNSNGQGDVFAGRLNQAANSIRRGLMEFDVAGAIPSGVTITSVTLELRDVQRNNGDRAVELHRLLQEWGEGGSLASGGGGAAAQQDDATWLYAVWAPAVIDRVPWGSPGGVFDAIASASTVVDDDMATPAFYGWSSPAMVADVQAWLETPASNHGWLIRGDESVQQTAKRFNSGESAETFRPVLHVTYVPEPSTAVILALAVSGASAIFARRRMDG